MSGVERAARKFDYLVAMPLPQPEQRCTVERMPGISRTQLIEWWKARQELCQQASDLQARLWSESACLTRGKCVALGSKLRLLSQKIAHVLQLWETVYADACAAGSSNPSARGFWTPRWRTMGTDDVCEIVVDGDRQASATPRIVSHQGPSMVLESAALYAMICACAQQIATLDLVDNDDTNLYTALTSLNHANSACAQVCATVLKRHAEIRNGCESLLLASHYFDKWLGNLTSAQAHYVSARFAREQKPSLLAVYFFAESARCLQTARRSQPVFARLDQLARYRHASGALVLAQAIFAAHTHEPLAANTDESQPVVYEAPADADATLEAPHALLVEALACARVAFALLEAPARDGPVARFFDKLLQRFVEMHSGFVPTLQTRLDSEQALRNARKSVRITSVSCNSETVSVLCQHRAARSASVSLDAQRAYQLRVPMRYASGAHR